MQDDNQPMDQGNPDDSSGSHTTTRKWQACCLAPTVAVAILLIFAAGAYMFSGSRRADSGVVTPPSPELQRRHDAFVAFAKGFFAAAKETDDVNEKALRELQSMGRGKSSLERVHAAFRDAVDHNDRTADQYRGMDIPSEIASRDKVQESLEMVAHAYETRRDACRTMLAWNGDPNDAATAEKWRKQVEQINRFTLQALESLQSAAQDNGLSREELRRVVSSSASGNWMDTDGVFGDFG